MAFDFASQGVGNPGATSIDPTSCVLAPCKQVDHSLGELVPIYGRTLQYEEKPSPLTFHCPEFASLTSCEAVDNFLNLSEPQVFVLFFGQCVK